MDSLQSSLHLFEQPQYKADGSGRWRSSFLEAVDDLHGPATWDLSAILGILSFGYTCGDRTLLEQVRQQPWLSRVDNAGDIELERIPEHGFLWLDSAHIASRLCDLLEEEALQVASGRKEIYILQSGGLDSRIVAGILAKLSQQGKLELKPVCVTWGLSGCRDVEYGRKTAEICGFDWLHVPLDHENLLDNIKNYCMDIAILTSPVHIHRMDWFKTVSKDAVVFAGSYGDSVGRAEFSGRHVLELDYLKPVNTFGLLRKDNIGRALEGMESDLSGLHQRCQGNPKYAVCECEMQGHYMRNLIGQAMSIIGTNCSLYQMFTHPKVYSFIWSVHPSLRDDTIYMQLLNKLNPKLLSLPWARTNRALSGQTVGAVSGLSKKFHRYQQWLSGPVLSELNSYVDPEWFDATGIFDAANVKKVCDLVKQGAEAYGFAPYEKWTWLASFRRMAESLEKRYFPVNVNETLPGQSAAPASLPQFHRNALRNFSDKLKIVYRFVKTLTKPILLFKKKRKLKRLKKRAMIMYPPNKEINSKG